MKKWYFGAALLAGWFCQSGTASAQGCGHLPSPVGAARIPVPEPLPCGPTPDLVPGPISPLAAPLGPPGCLDLPADHSSAFQCENCVPECHFFASVGAQSLVRQKLGAGVIAVQDPQNLDTGTPPPPGSPLLQRYNDVPQELNFGYRVTLGYMWENQSVEFTGFYLPESKTFANVIDPGRINLFFFNPPIGFEGDNGLWLQADRLRTTFRQSFWNAELNYRYTNKAVTEAELILGVRFVNEQETLSIFTDDDGIAHPDINGAPDPVREAWYFSTVKNRIVGPQIGLEWSHSLTSWFTFGVTGKAAVGVDFVTVETRLERGDGFLGFDTTRHEQIGLSQIYDVGAYLDLNLLEKAHVRFGYNALWLANVATAVDQIDFNLANTAGRKNDHGSIFYHGPMVELQLLF